MTKRLNLRKEVLSSLTPDELKDVVGAYPTQLGPPTVFECPDMTGYYQTLPVYYCVTRTG